MDNNNDQRNTETPKDRKTEVRSRETCRPAGPIYVCKHTSLQAYTHTSKASARGIQGRWNLCRWRAFCHPFLHLGLERVCVCVSQANSLKGVALHTLVHDFPRRGVCCCCCGGSPTTMRQCTAVGTRIPSSQCLHSFRHAHPSSQFPDKSHSTSEAKHGGLCYSERPRWSTRTPSGKLVTPQGTHCQGNARLR